ncbi:MAG: alpha/beta hydrolase [Anaerolineae bacterium]|nr:alpha/beta hydrolase [Anaerolineae bacterium]
MRHINRLLLIVGVIVLALVVGLAVFVNTSGQATAAAAAVQSDTQVQVTSGRWLEFRPAAQTPQVGLIFYPGGLVHSEAYAPLARAIAAQGYLVVIPPMPLNLAVFASDRATEVMAAYPAIRRWAIGGHSLGGAMAARYAYQHPSAVAGLALWASYPEASASLADRPLQVVSVYGTRDGLAAPDKIAASRPNLPPTTRYVAIEGGNHAQFGDYGPQRGDQPATLSATAQHAQVIAATVELLEKLSQ